MNRTFVETSAYSKALDSLKDSSLVKTYIEQTLIRDPKAGDVVKETGGLRKLRVPSAGKGKSGSYRVVYYDHTAEGEIYLIFLYPKSVQEDLSPEGKKMIKKLIQEIKKS